MNAAIHPTIRQALAAYLVHQPRLRSEAGDEHSWAMAAEAVMTAERIGSWLENVGDERKPSRFGPIGDIELVNILFGVKATPEQRDMAAADLRHRFQIECVDEIVEAEWGVLS